MTSRTKLAVVLHGLVLLAFTARLYFAYRSEPQLPASPEVFQTIDALFTAVTGHDTQRLADCQQRLAIYTDRGSLSAAAADRLNRVVALAQSGDWTAAAHRLYAFMQAQQRKAARTESRPRLTTLNQP